MNNVDSLIEKYKNDMISLSKRKNCIAQENFFEESEIKSEVNDTQLFEEKLLNVEKKEKQCVAVNKNETKSEAHYGTLKVMVFAGNEAFPVEAAKVEVYEKNGEELYSAFTDSGGIAGNFKLSAPDGKINDTPSEIDGFSLYIVRVSHPDYDTEIFENVQVFDGVESIQPVYFRVEDNEAYDVISELEEDE